MDTSAPINGHPITPATAEQIRKALSWNFAAGDGLFIRCRHLDLQDLVFAGAIPLPILESFSKYGATTTAVVMESPEHRAELLQAARIYASLAAVDPRISLDPSEPDPSVLKAAELPDSLVIRLMNAGAARRLGVDVQTAALFRRPESPAPDRAAPDGEGVRDATEPLAGDDTSGTRH